MNGPIFGTGVEGGVFGMSPDRRVSYRQMTYEKCPHLWYVMFTPHLNGFPRDAVPYRCRDASYVACIDDFGDLRAVPFTPWGDKQ